MRKLYMGELDNFSYYFDYKKNKPIRSVKKKPRIESASNVAAYGAIGGVTGASLVSFMSSFDIKTPKILLNNMSIFGKLIILILLILWLYLCLFVLIRGHKNIYRGSSDLETETAPLSDFQEAIKHHNFWNFFQYWQVSSGERVTKSKKVLIVFTIGIVALAIILMFGTMYQDNNLYNLFRKNATIEDGISVLLEYGGFIFLVSAEAGFMDVRPLSWLNVVEKCQKEQLKENE